MIGKGKAEVSMSIMNAKSPRSSFSGMGRGSAAAQRLERQTNFKVVIRVRPPLPRELKGEVPFQNTIAIDVCTA